MTSESWIEILALPAGQQPNWAAADSALRETNTYSQLTDEAELGDRDHSLDREDLRAAIATAREAIEDGTAERVSFNGLTIYLTWEHAWESPDISVCAAFDLLKKSGIAHIIGFLAQTDEPSPSAHPGSRADRLMASRETKLVLDGLVAELDDGDSDVADRVGVDLRFRDRHRLGTAASSLPARERQPSDAADRCGLPRRATRDRPAAQRGRDNASPPS